MRSGRREGKVQMFTDDHLSPHFEDVDGRRVFYVDGRPFTALAAEIPWWHMAYGRYKETMGAYDHLYLAAKSIGLNTLKVPVKWSMVESERGVYDFSYVDHVKAMAEANGLKVIVGWFGHYASGDGTIYRNLTTEMFAPRYVIEDDDTYPRAVDARGTRHHNSASYEDEAIVLAEQAAFRACLAHVKAIDHMSHTILMVQVENEIAVFGADRHNQDEWRDHSPAGERGFREAGATDDLRYSAWSLSSKWIRPLTSAGYAAYPIPLFLNFVGGQLVTGMIGGAPGEDVETYLARCPDLSFVGLNYYQSSPDACSTETMRQTMRPYLVGRNILAITETNSHRCAFTARLAFIAIGEFGAPLFAPWCLTVSYPTPYEPYVLQHGEIGNGAHQLSECYGAIQQALAPISYYARTQHLHVFMSSLPGHVFTDEWSGAGATIRVTGERDGQAIVVALAAGDIVVAGYRCSVSIATETAVWPQLRRIRVEKGIWEGWEWVRQGEVLYQIDQNRRCIDVMLDVSMVVRCVFP